jgi:aminomethyltransferase
VLKTTPLNAAHRQAGARMVDFGGWDMPVNYGSQVDEHHAVRNDSGMFDVSHMLPVDVRGAGARALLRRALANDVARLKTEGKALYSCMLNDAGGVVDDLIVYFLRDDWYRVVVNAGTADKDVAWLRSLAQGPDADARIEPRRDLAILAIQGPNARSKFWQAVPGARGASEGVKPFSATLYDDPGLGAMMICRTGYTGEDGFELILAGDKVEALWNRLRAAGVKPSGLGARDTLRLEAGMNLYGQDMDETTSPLESGLAWTVDLSDAARDFVGRRALEAHPPERELVGLVLTDRGGVLRSHQSVRTSKGTGETTSGTFSPTLGRSIALARAPKGVAAGDEVEVAVRDKALKARVVKPPFARGGKALV